MCISLYYSKLHAIYPHFIIHDNLARTFWGLLVLSGVKCFNKLFTCRVCKWISFHVHSNVFVKPLIIHEAITQSHARIKATCCVWISKHGCKNNIQTRIFANQLEEQYRTLKILSPIIIFRLLTWTFTMQFKKVFFFFRI